jgi:hypothetical protein
VSYLRLQIEETARYEGAPVLTPYRVSTVARDMPITSARLSPEPQPMSRADELRNIEGEIADIPDFFEPAGSYAERAYLNDLVFLLQIGGFVSTIVAGAGTIGTTGINSTTATGVNGLNSAVVNVASTAGFPPVGSFVLAGAGSAVTYTGITATSFTGCGSHAATTGGESIQDILPTGVYKHTFAKRGGSVAKTAQLIAVYTEAARYIKGQGYGCSSIGLNALGQVTADLMGLVYVRTTDPALTPVLDAPAILPLRRADLQLSWLAGTAETDDFTVSIANTIERRKTFGLPTRSYFADKMFHGNERVRVTGSIPKFAIADADVDALIAASTFAALARWRSNVNIGATTYPYSMNLDMPSCQYSGGSDDELSNNRRFGSSYDWAAKWDMTAGYDARISIVCAIPQLETYV